MKQAYRRKAREYHPDLHPDAKEKYTAKMADINAAFAAIIKRAKYDSSDLTLLRLSLGYEGRRGEVVIMPGDPHWIARFVFLKRKRR